MRKGSITMTLLAGAVLLGATASCRPKRVNTERIRMVAEKALMVSVDRPETVRIRAVSRPDSVFGRGFVTMEERMAISMAMMCINDKVMRDTDGLENMDMEDRGTAALMERQMSAMSAIRDLAPHEDPYRQSRGGFTGWKLKIEYEALTVDGSPYRSEYWFILDKDAQCVIKSFEIPLI